MSSKKPTTEDSRSRLDDVKMHRQSPTEKVATPPNHSPSELRRIEEQRPPSTYHPSEAAHHPPSLPPMQTITQPSPSAPAPPQEEQRPPPPPQPAPAYEPAARKMDVDENYDDSGDDKSATKQESQRNSPKTANGGPAPMSASGPIEQQA